ncbi:MAG: hypothetical protein FJ304_17895 [Planctomycetes bacterium]|nr:hypothetical protein [Planctomycetota bacterium]
MRHRYFGGAVLAAVVALGGPSTARAQEGGFQTSPVGDGLPIPTGQAGQPGFYISAEFVMLTQTKALGNQTIGVRGLFDATGAITGTPGTFVGTGEDVLNTRKMGRREFQPGHWTEIGYKFDTGVRAYVNYMQLYDAHYHTTASQFPLGFARRTDLADTFLSAPVYNFPLAFVGPLTDTAADANAGGGNTAGIWNAADQMDFKFVQRYQQAEIGLRTPLFATEYSSVYGLTGARFAWFFERFTWRTVDADDQGNAPPQNVAYYTNTLSQRMYGLFVGCGHEVYLGSMFSASLDLTGAAYMDVAKQRAKYRLGDDSTQTKFGRESFHIVPSVTANANIWFYPVEGIQMRIGYMGMTFFNTRYMREPVGFNFGNIDPNYGRNWFRLLHGFNVGIGFFF